MDVHALKGYFAAFHTVFIWVHGYAVVEQSLRVCYATFSLN